MKSFFQFSLLLLLITTGCTTGDTSGQELIKPDRGTYVPLSGSPVTVADRAALDEGISGTLFVLLDGDPVPVGDVLIYLAKILEDSEGELRMASMDRVNSPRSVTGSDGYFYFEDVPTGHYGLVLDLIRLSFMLADPETGEALIITFEEGDIVDLEMLIYDELPVDMDD